MEASVEFYADWFKWLEARASEMTHSEPLSLFALLSEVSALVQKDVALWQSLADVMHGTGIQIAVKAGTWVAKHGDPLMDTRRAMRAMRVKYGEVKGVKK